MAINFVYVRLGNLSRMLKLSKETWIWLTRPWGSSLFLSKFQMLSLKNKFSPPSGRLFCGWNTYQGSLGDVVLAFVETLSPGDPVFLIGSNYSPLSTDVFQWNHLFWRPSVKGSLVVGCLLNIFAANVSRGKKKTKEKHPKVWKEKTEIDL